MSFRLATRLTQTGAEGKFYTGGPVLAGPGGTLLCFCRNRLTVLEAESGAVRSSLRVTEEEADALSAMALHPRLPRLLVFTRGLECVELDLEALAVLRRARTQHQQAVLGARFDASGLCFATCSADKTLRVFDYEGLYCTHCFRDFGGVVTDVRFVDAFRFPEPAGGGAPGAPRYLVGLSRADCGVYDLAAKGLVARIDEHMNSISSVCVVGDVIVTSGKDGCVVFTRLLEAGGAAGEGAGAAARAGGPPRASLRTLKTVNIQECFLSMVFVSYDQEGAEAKADTRASSSAGAGADARVEPGADAGAPPASEVAFLVGPSFEDGTLMVLDLNAIFHRGGPSPFAAPAVLSAGPEPELVRPRAATPTEVEGYARGGFSGPEGAGGAETRPRDRAGRERYLDFPVVKGMSLNNGRDMGLSNSYFAACAAAQSAALEEDPARRAALRVSPAAVVSEALASPASAVELQEVFRSSYLYPELLSLRRAGGGPSSLLLVAPTSDNLIHLFDLLSLTLLPPAPPSARPQGTGSSVHPREGPEAPASQPRFCALAVSTVVGDSGEVLAMAQASDSEIAVATASHFLRIQKTVFSAEDPLYQRLYEGRPCYGHGDYVSCLASAPERGVFVSGGRDGTLRVWKRNARISRAQHLFLHKGESGGSEAVGVGEREDGGEGQGKGERSGELEGSGPAPSAPAPGPRYAPHPPAACVSPWECVAILAGHQDGVEAVALSLGADSFCVSGGDDKILRLYDLSPLPFLRTPKADAPLGPDLAAAPLVLAPAAAVMAHSETITSLLVSPDQGFVISTSADLSVKVWTRSAQGLSFGSERQGLCKRNIWASALSPVERLLALACGDRRIRILRVSGRGGPDGAGGPAAPTLSLQKTLEGHLNAVLQVRFINEGQQLVSSGADGLVKLWNLATGECVFTLAPRPPSDAVSELIAQGEEDAGFEAELQRLEALRAATVRDTALLADEAERRRREEAPRGPRRARRVNLSRAKAEAPRNFLGKIYAVQVVRDSALVIGLTNGLLCCAADTTALYAQLEEQARREELLEAHEFGMCLKSRDMARAFELALRIYIRSGYRRYEEVLRAVGEISEGGEDEGVETAAGAGDGAAGAGGRRLTPLARVVAGAGLGQLPNLLHLCQKLNRSSRTFEHAQALLEAVFAAFPPNVARLAYDAQLDPVLDDLLGYQRKHLDRVERYRVWAARVGFQVGE